MKNNKPPFHTFARNLAVLCFTGFLAFACTPEMNPDIQRGSDYIYRPGFPQVRFSAVGFLNENNEASINLAADIVYGSLIYQEENGQQQSNIAIDVRIVSQDEDDSFSESEHYEIEITRDDPSITVSQESFIFEESIQVPPGNYEVYFTLTDLQSDKNITRTAQTYIPDPDNNVVNLTDIRMFGKDTDVENPEWYPITTYTVQGRTDSLMFIFQVTNNDAEEPLTINTELVRFESDLSIARPIYYANYSPSSIEYKGIDYDETTQIAQSERSLVQNGSVFIELRFDGLPRGNYRFKVTSGRSGDELYKARDFGVKYKFYPALKTPRALARPLAYLMDEDEYEELMSISDPEELKQAVDRFWLSHIGNENEARQVIEKYYNRVVEANKQFSNFKAGWKTDTGMIYILFGPPWYVDDRLDEMRWSYAYNQRDPEYNYYFFQPRMENAYFPFQHWILQRDSFYFDVAYRQRQLWLSGLILQRNV